VHSASSVVVFGGTGRTGRLIVDEALRGGHAVTVAARQPDRAAASLPPGVRTVRADTGDAASVARAMTGQDAVIVAVSSPARRPEGLYSTAARHVAAAAVSEGVRRVVVISSGGVDRTDRGLPLWYRKVLIPLVMDDLYTDMAEMESIVTAGDLDWTIVRASYLRDAPARGRFRVEDGRTPPRGWRLARGDLARFTVDQLSTDRWLRRFPTLAD
jgi:uncharacterized protein YbjT (DUF2867 family)